MFHKKLKQMGAWALAFSLLLGSVQLPALEAKAADSTNLARTATATSSTGVETSFHGAEKAIDGDRNTYWSANKYDRDGKQPFNLQLAWTEEQTIKTVVIDWQRQNAKNYEVSFSQDGTAWSNTKTFTAIPEMASQTITLETPVTAKYVRLQISDWQSGSPYDSFDWDYVCVNELRIYAGEPADERTDLEKLADGITAPKPEAGADKIAMPEVPEGASIRFCADYEQVVAEDGTIYQPLEDKTIKGFYEIKTEEETEKTDEYTFTVHGTYADDETANNKPKVIPELQEWHGTSGKFVFRSTARIVTDAGLKAQAEEFAEDLKELTGKNISVVEGSASDVKRGDFYLTLNAENRGLGEEGYVLSIGDSVKIEAQEATGAYWGVISVLQILKQTGNYIVKGVARDYPKYDVRGFSFDVGRKPFSMHGVEQFAKNMSWYKMNSLQLHLSDNLIFHEDYSSLEEAQKKSYAGFRLESSLKPEEGSMVKTLHSQDMYYSKNEMRSFVRESRVRGLDIVPEFDMPAHALPITRAFPSLQSTTRGGHGFLIEELDLTQIDAATALAEKIWTDYFTDYDGNGPVFDEKTTAHIGTDEFHGGNHEGTQVQEQEGRKLFRQFSANMIEFIQGTGRTVRMWGSLTNKAGTTPVPSENVQLNVWNTGYANPRDMYDLGYDLINTLEGPNYIVPAAGYYNNYINAQNIYNNWEPNELGNLYASAGEDQMLGGCYAIWHDSVDTRANGISEYDSFDRFFQPIPAYSAKLWGDKKDTYAQMQEVAAKTGTAPGTDIYHEVKSASPTVVDYSFEDDLTADSSSNNYQGVSVQNAEQADSESGKALKLNGGKSYMETPLDIVGNKPVVTMNVKLDAAPEEGEEQILCESKEEFGTYGTYALKAVQSQDGKVGFSREGYDFSFDYALQPGVWTKLTFVLGKDNVQLLVNDELVDSNPAIYFANNKNVDTTPMLTRHGVVKTCTMMAPIGRIGSKTKSFKGLIDYVTVSAEVSTDDSYRKINQSEMTADACSYANNADAGKALDGDLSTMWHTDWDRVTNDLLTSEHPHWFEVTLNTPKLIDKLSYQPRTGGGNGTILKYNLFVTLEDGTEKQIVTNGTWGSNGDEKILTFEPVKAKKVKILILEAVNQNGSIAELNLYKALESDDMEEILRPYGELQEAKYTEESWKLFKNAYDKVKELSKDSAVSSSELMDAMEALIGAKEALEAKEVNASSLLENLEQTDHIDTEGADKAQVDKLETACDEAQKALENESISQEEMNVITEKLASAKAAVMLSAAVNTKVDTSKASQTELAAYQSMLTAARALLSKEQAKPAELEKALADLQKAAAELGKASGNNQNTEKPNPSPNPAPTTPSVPAKGTVVTVKDVQYKVTKSDANNGTATAVKLMKKTAKKITIQPQVTIDGYSFKVTAVNAKAFQNAKKLAAVTVGANIKNIGSKAFYKCKKLKKVTFKNVKAPKVGKQAFKGTAAKCKVSVPKKMAKKQFNLLKSRLKKSGMSKKTVYKK